ncbi:daunorubicin ABC transporter ATP-binding protein [Methanobacterium subterraneum]|uniref:Daunorubicin ABC transporter ATP-binding protein n=1 Tax=Methanobacterium subterraneum TaxID=59277 RepID=A0A2H4VAS3_9EURY|nr:ATP-binding cassette domain-containing protein [Methanobacterium subterraneum]AUB55194.1 daunorubicin ABC transporter ATP-binding protein [Methanobacterium subterraneum]PKL73992.1 MAG: daunorubicin ABC transporter ATP-binding protein [Methanobacteriales archaeon HGW-Methanobacteriales-2]
MKYAIETSDLTKLYGDFKAVDALNLKVKDRSIFGFLGPNGAGKTTTIKMLTCLIPPTSGTAKVASYDIIKKPNEVRQKIGMVPQLVSLYADLTARENAELCADYYGMPKDLKERRIDELMELVDIKYAENKLVKQLSGGQKQKVSVVASLVHQPDILFLDEPTIGLDPTTKSVLWDLIDELNQKGHTIILCSHDMYEVDMLCDHVGIINQGELAAFDTPQGLKDTILTQEECGETKIGEIVREMEGTDNSDHPSFCKLKEVAKESEIDKAREMSLMVDNSDTELVNRLSQIPCVLDIDCHRSGRLAFKLANTENAVTQVISAIMETGGNITSISTKDPSLEDVFMKVTAKKPNKEEEGGE